MIQLTALGARVLLTIALLQTAASALTINCETELHTVTAAWNDTAPIQFTGNRVSYYDALVTMRGLRFANGLDNLVDNNITVATGNTCPIVSVTGSTTRVTYNGTWHGDGFNAYNHLHLADSGRLVIGPDAVMDCVNSAFFTRQLWVLGDGSGALEIDSGFVADNTAGGTSPVGIGAYRFSNAILITNHTRGLPQHVRPNCTNMDTGYNGHLVFEDQPGSRWIVDGSAQRYHGSVWIRRSVTIETRVDLIHDGVLTLWGDYTLAGAFQTLEPDLVITKEGPARLVLEGEQAYSANTRMDISAGEVVFDCDATGGYLRPGDSQGAQELTVAVASGAGAIFTAPRVRIAGLDMSASAHTTVAAGCTVSVAGDAALDGILHVTISDTISQEPGTTYQLFEWTPTGAFADLDLPEGPTWDTSRLYTDGTITLTSGTVQTHWGMALPRTVRQAPRTMLPWTSGPRSGPLFLLDGRVAAPHPGNAGGTSGAVLLNQSVPHHPGAP